MQKIALIVFVNNKKQNGVLQKGIVFTILKIDSEAADKAIDKVIDKSREWEYVGVKLYYFGKKYDALVRGDCNVRIVQF